MSEEGQAEASTRGTSREKTGQKKIFGKKKRTRGTQSVNSATDDDQKKGGPPERTQRRQSIFGEKESSMHHRKIPGETEDLRLHFMPRSKATNGWQAGGGEGRF